MSWKCDRGCLTDGQPTMHASMNACPVIKAEKKRERTSTVPERKTEPRSPEAPATPPKKEEPKSAWDKAAEVFGFTKEPAKTVAAPNVPEKQEAYLLESEDVVSFWQLVFSLLEMGLNLFMRFMGGKEFPEDLFDIKGSKASSLLISRNMRHTTSQLFITAGVRTKAEAVALIGEGEGILSFGHIFVGIGWHAFIEIPKSEKWREWSAKWDSRPSTTPAPAPSSGGAANAWWDPLGVFTKKEEARVPAEASTALALPGGTATA